MRKEPFLETGTKKAIIYLRVSTEDQVENYSLGTQEEICRREALHRGYEVAEVFREEGKSAKNIIGRPELLRVFEYCKKNRRKIQALIVYRVDRLSRQTQDYLSIRRKLAENGIKVISATEPTGDSPTEKLIETVLAGFAQHDNDVRSERTKNGMRARFLSGLSTNQAPLGYINQGGYVLKDPESFDKVKKLWDLMETGSKSLREITVIINKEGIVYRGKVHKPKDNTVQRMFRNKFYMGILTSNSYPEEVKGQHTPMVSEEQFYKVQAILDGRSTTKFSLANKSRNNEDFPLRRIVICGKCKTSFTGAWSKGRTIRYGYYFCRKRCVTTSVTLEDLNAAVLELLKRITATPECLELYIASLCATYYRRLKLLEKRKAGADGELRKLYETRQILVEKNITGVFSDEIFKEQNRLLEQKIASAQNAKSDALLDKYNIDVMTDFLRKKLSNLAETYATSTLAQKRVLLGSIFPLGMVWSYPGISNHQISPIYQAIRDFSKPGAPGGEL